MSQLLDVVFEFWSEQATLTSSGYYVLQKEDYKANYWTWVQQKTECKRDKYNFWKDKMERLTDNYYLLFLSCCTSHNKVVK